MAKIRMLGVFPFLLLFSFQNPLVRPARQAEKDRVAWLDYRIVPPAGETWQEAPGGGRTARLLLETERILRKRLQALPGVEAKVLILGRRIRVEVKDPSPERIRAVKATIRKEHLVEFRWVLDEEMDGLDPKEEKARFEKWLEDPRNRALLLKDPSAVEVFNSLPPEKGGPLGAGKVRWAPLEGKPWGVKVHVSIPPEDGRGKTISFVPLRMDLPGFNGREMAKIGPTQDRFGLPAVFFRFKKGAARAFEEATGKYKGHAFAILVGGVVRSCPVVQCRLQGEGIITGGSRGFKEEEVDSLVKVLNTASLPVRLVPVGEGVYNEPEKKKCVRKEKIGGSIPLPRTRPPSAFRLETGTGLPGAIRVYKADLPGPIRCFAVYVPWNAGWEIRTVKSRTPAGKEPLTSLAKKWKALVAVNGGYFNMKARPCREEEILVLDGKMVSPPIQEVTVDGKPAWVSRAAAGFYRGGRTEFRWVFLLNRKLWSLPKPLPLPRKPPLRPGAGWTPWSPPWILQVGPMLLHGGRVFVSRKVERLFAAKDARHPRTALGTTARKETVFLIVEGRQKASRGTTLVETARLLQVLGCRDGMNLDGGGSSTLVIRGRLWNLPQGKPVQRPVPNGVVVLPQRRGPGRRGPSGMERKGGPPVSFPAPSSIPGPRR